MKIHPATASFPGKSHLQTVEEFLKTPDEPLFAYDFSRIQICPQTQEIFKPEIGEYYKRIFNCELRLHANTRVWFRAAECFANSEDELSWHHFGLLKKLSWSIKAPCYTLHTGKRTCTLPELFARTQKLQDFFKMPVAIEGQYPLKDRMLLVDSFDEYEKMVNSGLHFVLDLSHLQIVKNKERTWDAGMVQQWLSHPNCLEVHISDNDGKLDEHKQIEEKPFWWDLLKDVKAPIFCESNHYKNPHGKSTNMGYSW